MTTQGLEGAIAETSSPLVPYLMRAPSLGQVWVYRVPRYIGLALAL